MKLLREACVETKEEIDSAVQKGADRLELCSDLFHGGLTPTQEMIDYALSSKIPTIIMIRRKFDNYQTNFFNTRRLIKDIKKTVDSDIEGFVFGILTKDNKVNIKAIKKLLKHTQNKKITFHMAFDSIENKVEAIDQLSKLGVHRILTKGGITPKAVENVAAIKSLVEYAEGKIELVIGGKVMDDNYQKIAKLTGAREFHGRKLACGI